MLTEKTKHAVNSCLHQTQNRLRLVGQYTRFMKYIHFLDMGGGGGSSVTDIILLELFCELCIYAEEIKHPYDTITNLLYSNSH